MLLAKTIMVVGQKVTRAGQTINTIGEEIDKAVNGFLAQAKGKLVNLTPTVDLDKSQAVVSLLYETEEKKGGK